jgi:hypothetical protein
MFAMKQKPRWMQSVIKAAMQERGPLPFGRQMTATGKAKTRSEKPVSVRA